MFLESFRTKKWKSVRGAIHFSLLEKSWHPTYFASIDVILKSMLWIEVKIFVAPWTTHSRVSGIAIGVHHDRKTGSLREHKGNTPENRPSIKTTCKKSHRQTRMKSQSFWAPLKIIPYLKFKQLVWKMIRQFLLDPL